MGRVWWHAANPIHHRPHQRSTTITNVNNGALRLPLFCMATYVAYTNIPNMQNCCERLISRCWPMHSDHVWILKGGRGGGGITDLEKGVCGPEDLLFICISYSSQGPIWATCSSQGSHFKHLSVHKPPFEKKKTGNFSLFNLKSHPNFSSQAPKFENFQFTRPPFQRQWSVCKPHPSEILAAHPYLKKVGCPLPQVCMHHKRWLNFQNSTTGWLVVLGELKWVSIQF